jgi:hypothetical protein
VLVAAGALDLRGRRFVEGPGIPDPGEIVDARQPALARERLP